MPPSSQPKSRASNPAVPRGRKAPVSVAAAALRSFRAGGETSPEGTTPERLLRAGGTARLEAFSRDVEVERDGRPQVETIVAHRIRIEDGPLARLRARNLLASGPDASFRNAALGAAGERFRQHWHSAGLAPLNAIDPSRERVSGGMGGLLRTERQLAHFQAYGAALKVLAGDVRRSVEAIVLHDREPVDVGREVSGYRQDKQSTAVALYLLRAGLEALARHFGLLGRT